MRQSSLVAVGFVLVTAGCSGYWGRRPIDPPRPLKPHEPVWIWSGGEVMKWHDVVITPDSVAGFPYKKSLHCDGCRQSIPRAQVDSMKVGYHTLPENVALMLGVVTAATILDGIVCYLVGAKDNQC
jgi:hypothetical protein